MKTLRLLVLCACAAVFAQPTGLVRVVAQQVPSDLKPLLAAPASEMRLVVTRYNLDRQTLYGNYAGGSGGGRGGGRGAASRGGGGGAAATGAPATPPAAPSTPVPLSPAR